VKGNNPLQKERQNAVLEKLVRAPALPRKRLQEQKKLCKLWSQQQIMMNCFNWFQQLQSKMGILRCSIDSARKINYQAFILDSSAMNFVYYSS